MTQAPSRYPDIVRALSEARLLFALAWPIMITQLAQEAMGFVDTLMTARAGATELAAVALGTSLWLPLMLTLIGVLMATTPLVANRVGAGQEDRSATHLIESFSIALLLGAISVLLLNQSHHVLRVFDLSDELAGKSADYLQAISWGFPALMLFQALRSFMEGFGCTRPVMVIATCGVLINIPLNYIFIFGKLGMPALGGVGCGYATSIILWVNLLLAAAYVLRARRFKTVRDNWHWQLPRPGAIQQFLKLGLPIGFALLIEASMFSVISLLVASDGEEVIGAHQITFSITGLIFMIPLSLALALTIRIGQQTGRNDYEAARFSALVGFGVTLIIALTNSSVLFLGGSTLAGIYTESTAMISLTVTLIQIAALFQLADAIQVCAGGMLRGYKDTAVTLAVVLLAYWAIGLPAGHWLARGFDLGVAGYWWGLLIGLTTGAVLLSRRLYRISHAYETSGRAAFSPAGKRLQ